MSFLNPLMLFGLAAAALPVLIHLFSRRRAKDVSFPSIEFLERMKTDRMRRLRFRQIIALLLRTLAVIAVVLAFSRPAVRSSFHETARTAAVVIMDASASMRYVDNGEILFDDARRKTQEILGLFGEGDRAAVIIAGREPLFLGSGPGGDMRMLARDLRSSQASFGSADADAAFRAAQDVLRSAPAPNRELYYLTDCASNALPESLAVMEGEGRPNVFDAHAGNPVRLYVVPLGPDARGGAVVEDVTLRDRFLAPGKRVAFLVSGASGSGEGGADVEFFVNGERKGRKEAAKAGSRFEIEFEYTFDVPDWYSVEARTPDGRFEPGETRRMVVRVPEKKRILICGGVPADFYFLKKALQTGSGDSAAAVSTVTAGELTAGHLNAADAVILSGVRSLPPVLYRTLLSAVMDRGAGLVVFPPTESEPSLYADGIFRDIFPASVEKRVAPDMKGGYSAFIDRFDLSHPVLENMSSSGRFQRPNVRSYLGMVPRGAVSVIARFSDGSAAIGSSVCGRGKAVVFGVGATLESGDFPLTGLFAPLLLRSVQYVSGSEPLGGRYEVGEPVRERVGKLAPGEQVMVKPEHGPVRAGEVAIDVNGAVVKDPGADAPGFYSVLAGAGERARFSVDIPRSELRFERAGTRRMAEAFSGFRWKTLASTDNLAEAVRKDRYGTELSGMFLLLAAALLAAEMAVSRRA